MKQFIPLLVLLLLAGSASSQTYTVGTQNFTWTDPARSNRSIPLEIRYPGTNSTVANDSFPFIVFGHGFQMTGDNYYDIVDSLIKQGYIVALAGTETSISPSHADFGKDFIFIYNKLISEGQSNASSPFYHHVIAKGAIGGHSMGGGSTVLSCQFGTPATCYFTFAAANTNPSSISAAHYMDKPYLAFAGSRDCIAPPAANQLPMYDSSNAPCKVFVEIKDATHCQFGAGNVACNFGEGLSGCAATPLARNTQIGKVLSFLTPYLEYYLKGKCSAWTNFEAVYTSNTTDTLKRNCTNAIPSSPLITGNLLVCPGNTTTLNAAPSGFNYSWSNGSQTQQAVISSPGTYTVTVSNGTCSVFSAPVTVTQQSLPANPSSIVAPDTVCSGISSITLSVNNDTSVTSYQWTLPSGWTFNNDTTTPTVDVTSSGTGGTITVTAQNGCGNSQPITKNVVVIPSNLGIPGAITGPDTICAGASAAFSIATVSGATGYQWTLPAGFQAAVTDSTALLVTASQSGGLQVVATNECGNSIPSVITVTVDSVPALDFIIGPDTFCTGFGAGTYYAVNTPPSSVTWHWVIPNDWSFVGNTNTYSSPIINVASAGAIEVSAANHCGTGNTVTLNVAYVDTPHPTITAINNVLHASPGGGNYTWYLDGQQLNGVTGDTCVAVQPGLYKVVVSDSSLCSGSAELNFQFNGLNEAQKEGFLLYPNPASDILTIYSPVNEGNGDVCIYNMLSQLVLKAKLTSRQTTFNISALTPGKYVVAIPNGTAFYHQQLTVY